MCEAALWLDRAEAMLALRELSAAKKAFDRAERLGASPDRCCGGRWQIAMLQGHFQAAWRQSDALRARNAVDPHRLWDGQDIQGKRLILRCLHGLGDAVQMLRFAPILQDRAAHLVIEVPPALLSLASCCAGVSDPITWGDLAPCCEPTWDVQIELMELPYLLRTRRQDLPFAERYVHLPAEIVQEAALVINAQPRMNIGFVWSAGEWNASRSLPFKCLEPLLTLQGCTCWNLQGGSAAKEAMGSSMHNPFDQLSPGLLGLASAISQLDLIISVDTLAAHLAGALGKAVFLLLQHHADWRWMSEGSRSPWYPSMLLFRQPTAGDWDAVVLAVRNELRERLQGE